MRFSDLLAMALGGLRQRIFRTSLTVLGVVIGTMAVVVMLSIGNGMSAAQLRQAQQEDLRQIQVWSLPRDEQTGEAPALNGAAIAQLKALDGVESVYGMYMPVVQVKLGSHKVDIPIMAIPAEQIASLDLDYAAGGPPTAGGQVTFLYDPKVTEYYFMDPLTGRPADIDLATVTATVSLLKDSGMDAEIAGEPKSETMGKKITVPSAGLIHSEPDEWTATSGNIYADQEAFVAALRKAAPGQTLPGQKNAKASLQAGTFEFESLVVMAKDATEAEELSKLMQEQHYEFSSQIEWIKQVQAEAAQLQVVLGGIGFISLFVAAIGIANTMLMSVYERTKEIGIMKVLGASLRDIRTLFLFESASIGLVGGLLGVALSYAVSQVINSSGGLINQYDTEIATSIITIPLALSAVVGAALIGAISGLAPAQRAMKLSPLAAIRSE